MATEKDHTDLNIASVASDSSRVLDTLRVVASQPMSISEVAEGFTPAQKDYILKKLNFDTLVSFDELPVSVSYMMEKIDHLSVPDAVGILEEFAAQHSDDVNIKTDDFEFIERLLASAPTSPTNAIDAVFDEKNDSNEKTVQEREWNDSEYGEYDIFDWALQVKTEAGIIEFHSAYPEVRAVTEPYDDVELPVETLRVYIVGIIWTCIGAFINEFFLERQPSISLSAAVVQIFLYPSGTFLAWVLPKRKIKIWKWSIDLNPGPWNHKEQMLATLFYSVSGGTPYVSYNIPVIKMDKYYGIKWADWGYQILLILSTQFMGFGFAGIMRKFAVYPTRSIWPSILPTLALNKALVQKEPKENINGWKISRYNFFLVAFIGSFVYFWLPDYLFEALSYFNWMTWIAPNNATLAVITGSIGGLGLNPITTFDWNIISFNSALIIPFYSQLNQYIGSIIAFFCIIGVWYSNYKWTGYLPINSNSLFTNTGDYYSVSTILDENNLMDQAKYEEYGPPFYTAANLVLYGSFFAIYPFTVLYVGLTQWSHIKFAFGGLWGAIRNFRKSTFDGYHDAYSRSMRNYKEVPEWCFLIVLVISIVLAIICVEVYPMETPVWSVFFAVGINFVFLIPLTLVYSITGFSFGLNVLVELIVGYALPGNGMALMFIKALGYNIDGQAQNYITDQKMAHYVRIPPRALFRSQILSTLISCFISLAVINFTIDNIENYCETGQAQKFTCPSATTFYSSSVFWGVIGPKKVFSGLYPILKWCFFIGFLLAPVAFLVKRYLRQYKVVKYFEPVLIIGGFLIYAPYNLSYITPGFIASFFFMYVIRDRYLNWFKKYTFLLSGALTAGVAFSSIIIFFAVQYHDKSIDWWGNSVSYSGLDASGFSNLDPSTAPDGYFGPRAGNYP
ncbi:OPT-domain-containing protein [Metschnikowia bicuspidata var. bicuspidata NRRL YB-4993]|uniref:OPT-domain-containing protein n=1 Tax=Metschnikowia bicuspidata var. bicuspidata NRRL YB-4993 TaxID=869754 RepID=A0A1A0HA90_9ASCO|nr:OPT-domain-containing protein [Metschnikowia bicuspidata var. bicuspidata NRRL YB-4993]OBA20920.1 OPT-domain-containing protein [Metschnikowia bicuspidata var. bicuspidata NRRL YB-4993]